jgi:alpha-1,6-mannosyltransferase
VGAGSGLLLGVCAWLAGALPSGDPAGWTVPYVLGLLCWLTGGIGICLAWLRSGAGVAIKALWALPLVVSPPLGSRDVYAYACQGWLWLNDIDPYSAGVADGGCPWAASVPEIWWHTPAPYGPLAIAVSGLAAATGGQLAAVAVLRLVAVAAAVALAWCLAKLGGEKAVVLGAVTPLMAVHGVSGAHNDVLVAAGIAGALLTARRGHALTAGVLIAAAVAVKVTAVVALPFLLIMLGRRWWAAAGAAVTTFAGLTLATGLGLGWVNALAGTGKLVQWSSVPTAIGMAFGYVTGPQAITIARGFGLAVLAAAGIFFLRMAFAGRQLAACAGMLAATALLGPVFFPWYALAALAVAALVGVPGKWLVTATVACTFLALPNGHGIPAMTKAVGAYAVTAIVAAVVIRTVRRRWPARGA